MSNQNQRVMITGASSGIGAACARLFAQKGAKVALAARRIDRLKEITQEIEKQGGTCIYKQVDVQKKEDVESWLAQVLESFGSVDILINNAGVGCVGKVATIPEEYVRQVFDINFFGALYCIQAVMPPMRKQGQGHILNVSSVIGKRSIPEIGFYCATKFALNAMSDSLRLEVRKHNIHVTTISPGLTETEFSNHQIRPPKAKSMRAKFRGQSSEKVAQVIYKATQKKPRDVYLTLSGKFLVQMERFSPWIVDQLLKAKGAFYGSDKE